MGGRLEAHDVMYRNMGYNTRDILKERESSTHREPEGSTKTAEVGSEAQMMVLCRCGCPCHALVVWLSLA